MDEPLERLLFSGDDPGKSRVQEATISFGSNEGHSIGICLDAVQFLGRHAQVRVMKVSSLYATKPVGPVSLPWFINGVLQCLTDLSAEGILEVLFRIEGQFGRVRIV